MIKAAVIGGSGYSGAELIKILAGHPNVKLSAITSTRLAGKPITELYPNLLGNIDLTFTAYNPGLAKENDVVFLALPHGKAMEFVPELLAAGSAKIIDISGDLRLPAPVYKDWYGKEHAAPELFEKAVYGLSEINKDKISKAALIANPGCYPTGIILAAAPLLAAGALDGAIVANCLSGISGAGRALTESVHYCAADENVGAYKVGGIHQHIPEIEQSFAKLSGGPIFLVFTPQLASFSRGIYTTLTVKTSKDMQLAEVRDLFVNYYEGKQFIKIMPVGAFPQVKAVAGSNYCHIGVAVDERTGHVIIISAIDNLVKGAAGQAVQNMNLMFELDEATGLKMAGLYP